MKHTLLTSLLTFSVLNAVTAAHADVGLPYFGDRAAACQVNELDANYKNLDAGYVADESCSTIYVLPPMLGTLNISPPAYLRTDYCKFYEQTKASIEKIGAAASEGDIEEQTKMAAKLASLNKSLNSIGRDEAFSLFSFTASLDWNVLVGAYQKANPKMRVQRMPVVTGLLNASVTNTDLQSSEGRGPLLNLKIFAPGFNGAADNSDAQTADIIGKITSSLDTKNTFIFGSAVAGQMSLRMIPTCALFSEDGKVKTDPKGYFAGTYTYFYPVQTSSSYEIRLSDKKQDFEGAIFDLVKRQNGTITGDQINEIVKKIPVVSIIKKDGMGGNGDSDALETTYKDKMMLIVANSVVATVADRIATAVSNAKYNVQESHIQNMCSGDWPFRHCWDHEYFITVTKIDWAKVESKLGNMLSSGDNGAKKYRVMYLYGTSAFANVGQNDTQK